MIHKQENNNIKEVIPLLLRFWTPRQSSQLGDPTKGLGSPRESDLEDHQDLIIGLPQGLRETKTPILEEKNNLVCINTEWKWEVIPQKTESKLPASVRGSPVELWVGRSTLLIPPFFLLGHLCLLPPSSLLCITPWISLSDPDCGAHIRKWLLASLLSPLLIPPHLILVTSISLLPLLVSM